MNGWLDLLDKYIKKYLPAEKGDIEPPSKSDSKSNQISRENDISPGLLIGANSTKTLESVAIIISSDNRTFAFKMKFAWCVKLTVDKQLQWSTVLKTISRLINTPQSN